ncbi:MAG: thioredoxin family protein [Proteobacteria bacterium]|nr:thioredoxin family protein [Pseudomonadota bacterium]
MTPIFNRLRRAGVAGLAGLAVAVLGAAPARGEPVRTPHVEAELVAQRTALVPGTDAVVALRLAIADGWHTYWRNAGDSGLPTTLDWTLPAGYAAGPIQWLPPRVLPTGPLVNYGYEGVVLHPVHVTVPASAVPGSDVTLKARADWLVCRDTCIPEGADLTLTLPVAPSATDDPKWGAPIAAALAAVPKPLSGWTARAEGEGQAIRLVLTRTAASPGPDAVGDLRFFPDDDGRIEPSGKQVQAQARDGYVVTLPVAYSLAPNVQRLAGLVTASDGIGGARAATIDVPLTGTIVAGPKPLDAPVALNLAPAGAAAAGVTVASPAASSAPAVAGGTPNGTAMTFGLALAFAFCGGILLNLMPCVFPVLTLKVLGFAEHHDNRATLRREAAAFAAGAVLSFLALAGLLLALRAAGAELGWGFQLQSPLVVTALALLFFALGLNLAGVFEFGQFAPSRVRDWRSSNRTLDAFGSGVLAVVVASPCTAPFMGAALGFALTEPAALTLAIFAALGIGMALPYTLLALFPAWRRALPRPGAWMARFKQLLAFPMFATVAWLAWVLGAQIDNDAVLRLLAVLLCTAFALWALQAARMTRGRTFGVLAVLGAAAALWIVMPLWVVDARGPAAAPAVAESGWSPFNAARAAELAGGGQPVFVDFTAAWCVTCQVNKRTTLNRPDVQAAFASRNVALMRADWTRRDPEITRALAALGRNGVPVYVLYRPGAEPLLLPEILTQQAVLDALAPLPAR